MSAPSRIGPILLLSLLAALALPGCRGAVLVETPEQRGPGTPLTRSSHPRMGSLTYRLGQVQRQEDGVRVDLTLQNGSSRDIEQGVLRVILMGGEGRELTARLPFVGLARGQARAMSARFEQVDFPVVDVGLEVIFVLP